MKILITGGAGFIGSHVAEELLNRKYEIVILDNLSTGSLENINYLKNKFKNQKFEFIKADVSDKKSFEKIEGEISAIVHLAAVVSVPESIDNPIETNSVTLGGSINLFEFAKKHDIKKIIQASSAAVYGEVKKFPVKESYAGGFISPYAISKFACELYADYFDKVFGIKTISFRFFNVYGERQNSGSPYSGVISKFVDCFKNKKEITIFGDGKNTRDFIYVKDVAEIIAKIVDKKINKSGVYNLGTGKEITLLQMVKTLEKIFKYKMPINFLPKRVGDINKSVADISKVKKDLKFDPKYSLEQGLVEMLKH